MARTISDLVRTMSNYFRFGSVRIRDQSLEIQARNADDSDYVDLGGRKLFIRGGHATNALILTAPTGLTGNRTYQLPDNQGSSHQGLRNSATPGILEFADAAANADLIEEFAFDDGTTSPSTIFTPGAGLTLTILEISIDVAAGGGSPTIKIGTAATPDLYLLTTEVDLKTAGLYEKALYIDLGGSPDPITLTIVTSAQTFSGRIFLHYATAS